MLFLLMDQCSPMRRSPRQSKHSATVLRAGRLTDASFTSIQRPGRPPSAFADAKMMTRDRGIQTILAFLTPSSAHCRTDRKNDVSGKSVSHSVDLGVRRISQQKT